jgi:hypothetical protein
MTEIRISENIQISQWKHGQWIIFASTKHEDGRYLGFTKSFGNKQKTINIARQWAKFNTSQLREICNSI